MPTGSPATINSKGYRSASLEDYQREIVSIWPQLQERPALHTWLRVVQHATVACEGVRKNDWNGVLKEIAKTIVWWLAFIEKLNELSGSPEDDEIVFALPFKPSKIVWQKYPGVCPVEFGLEVQKQAKSQNKAKFSWSKRPAQRCRCLARKEEVEGRSDSEKRTAKAAVRAFAEEHRAHQPQGVSDLENVLRETFAGPVYTLNVEEISFHLLEEVGEVSEALAEATTSQAATGEEIAGRKLAFERKRNVYGISEELADVFSWAVTLLAKIKQQYLSFDKYFKDRADPQLVKTIRKHFPGPKEINLADIIWQEYGLKFGKLQCADCGKRPCECEEANRRTLRGDHLEQCRKTIQRVLARLE